MAQGANDKTFWDKTKATAKKFTYKATISVKQRNILGVKQRLGVGVYAAFEDQDEAFARELFLKARAKIALLEDGIINCELKIAEKCDLNYVPKFVPSAAAPRNFRTDRKKPLAASGASLDEADKGSSNQSYYSPKSKEWAGDGKTGDTHSRIETTNPSSCSSSSTRGSNSMQTASNNHNTSDSRESFHSTHNADSSEPSTPKSREFHSVEHRSASPEYVVAGRQSESDAQKQASTKSTQSLGIPYSRSSNNISATPSTSSSSSVSQRMAQYDGNSNNNSSVSTSNNPQKPSSFGQNNHDANVPYNASASQKASLPQSSSNTNLASSKPASSSQKMPLPPSHKPNLFVSAPTSTNSVPTKTAPTPVTSNSFSSPSNNLSPKASTSSASSSFSSPSNNLSPKSACASSSSPKAGSANWGAAESASRSTSPSPSRANWGSAETNASNTPKSSPRAQSPSPRAQSPSPSSGGGGGGKVVSGTNALLLWTQQSTEGYNGVSITNFTSSWQSGIAFAALLHAHQPGLLDLNKLNPSQATATCQVAFDAAEKAGVAILVDAEDMKIGDKKCTIVQLQMYHKTLAHDPPSHAGRDAWNRKFH